MSRVYLKIISSVDRYVPPKLRPLWEHPAGPKTVFFWSPFFKWGLVIASLSDLKRPAELISVRQSAALAATGAIWTRYCLVIYPVNYNLAACNFFVGCTGVYQMYRALKHRQDHPETATTDTTDSAVPPSPGSPGPPGSPGR